MGIFGTDGIRAKAGQYPITPEGALKLGWAVGCVLQETEHTGPVLISKDTRLSGYLFESALEAGLVASGVDVCQLGPMPTPAVAYLTRSLRARAGIVISASHNAYEDNGFKFFSSQGKKFSRAWEIKVEKKILEDLVLAAPQSIGRAHRLMDVRDRYIEFCKSTFSRVFDLRDFKIVLDCAHGATYQVAPALFAELGASLVLLGNQPNGLNINEGCGSTHPALLQKTVLAEKADLGIAFDGDGDRVVLVDHVGNLVDGDQILYILAKEYKRQGRLTGGVVGTLMTNLGLEFALRESGIAFARSQVGDKHVLAMLLEKGWNLGGETSGHILCLDKTTTGDGLISALQVIQIMCDRGLSLLDLGQGLQKSFQILRNVAVSADNILEHPTVSHALSAGEASLAGRGRILVRCSGTEPVIRVMVEGEDPGLIASVASDLASVIEARNMVPG